MKEDNIEALEVIGLYKLKKMRFSLEELGYTQPLDANMAEDLLYLDSMVREKQMKDMKK